ncbi:MAG: glycosyltransferase family 2 protein [Candidatus Nanopelagicales bacterium]
MTVPQLPGARVRQRRRGTAWQVRVTRTEDLARLVPVSIGAARITELDLTVQLWAPPQEGWLGRPSIARVARIEAFLKGSGVALRLVTSAPSDAGALLSAALRCLRPIPSGEAAAMLTFAPGLPVEAAPFAARVVDVLTPEEVRDPHVRRADVLVVPSQESAAEVERARTVVVSGIDWRLDGMPMGVHVDPAVQRPVGRRSVGGVVASGTLAAGRFTVSAQGLSVVIDGDISTAQARELRGVRGVVVDAALPHRLATQLAACGLVVSHDRGLLPPEEDGLGWQAASVRARRAALRDHSPAAGMRTWPSVSVVIVTNRPDHLDHMLAMLSGLRYPDLEVVIGSHGDRMSAARIWERATNVPHRVTVLPIDSGKTLGQALQMCSDRAEGDLLTKMDDDDIYAPEHVWDLVIAREYSGAQVVGKALDWVYLQAQDTTVFRPAYGAERYADFVAGGTILISCADLMAVGGWRPVPKSVDRALLDRVIADGGLVYRTHGLGYVYVRHQAGHTASVSDDHFLTKVVDKFDGVIAHEAFGTQAGLVLRSEE